MQSIVTQTLAFGAGETCADCINATIDRTQDKRVLAIINHSGSSSEGDQGLFLYKSRSQAINTGHDLVLEKIIPITADFKYDVETKAEDQSVIQVKISTRKENVIAEVPFDSKSSNFFVNLKKASNGSIDKSKKGISQNFQWLEKYQLQVKSTISTVTRPNTVADPFGMSAFDTTASSHQYVNSSNTGKTQPQRATVSSDTRTQDHTDTGEKPSYINAPHDPWEGMQPLVQFNSGEEANVVHPKPPAQQEAWTSAWSASSWASSAWQSVWPSSIWPTDSLPSTNSSNSTFYTGSIDKSKKGISQNFQWLEKYQLQVKSTISTVTRPNTVADPFGMSAFDTTASSHQYVNLSNTGKTQPQRATVSSDTRTQHHTDTGEKPSYINAPHDPWEGMQPLVQFNSGEEANVVHPKPPAQQEAWTSAWSASSWASSAWQSVWPSSIWPTDSLPSTNSSNSTFYTGSIDKSKKGISQNFQWLEKYQLQVKSTISTVTRPNTVADPFGMSAFDTTASTHQYVNLSNTGKTQPQRATVSSDTRTQHHTDTGEKPSYINAPHDPWEGMQPLVQFNSGEEANVVHPKPPAQQEAWTSAWSASSWASSAWQSVWPSSIWPTDSLPSTNSSNSTFYTGFDSGSQPGFGFEDSFNDVLTLDSSSSGKGTLTNNTHQTITTGSLSSLSVPSSSSSSSLYQPDHEPNLHLHTNIQDETDAAGYAEVRPVARFRPAGVREEILKRREKEYTFLHDFRVFVGTWNVNGQAASEDLYPWLGKNAKAPDIYALGFQELDLSKEAFLFNDSIREEEWVKALDRTLTRVGTYIRLKMISLVGMMLVVYVQERHVPFISELKAEWVDTGIMGKMGNKGGVAVRFEFHNTSFCFVNSHLAAHMEEFERRNQDYNDICNRMAFEWDELNRPTQSIRQHDIVVWMGDLNYRISSLEVDVVKTLIAKNDYLQLLKHDQLFQQLELQKVFHGFSEGPIAFQPTYKYDPGTDEWDTSEKQRVPAWCDRILFKGSNIKQKIYQSHMELKLSDHKPVSSLFDIAVKVVDEKAFKQVVEEEIESMPQVTLSRNNIDYGEVRLMEAKSQTFDVANTGQVNTEFKFANKLDDKHFCKPFLKVEPSCVFLMPGDSIEITITVLVDKDTASSLNSGADQLEDILVLHLDNGKDYYIMVSGRYIPSSFGCSIEALVKMHPPICELTSAQVVDLEADKSFDYMKNDDEFAKFDIPKEIWMLVDHLFRYATKSEELFSKVGLHTEVLSIIKYLDNGMMDSMPGSIHSVAEALLLFLECLREPVIPQKYYERCLECCNNFTLCKMVLKQIPKSHRNVFKYLAAFIRELRQHSDDNKLDDKTLATVFGEMFLRTPKGEGRDSNSIRSRQQAQKITRKKATFVYQFIINEYDD